MSEVSTQQLQKLTQGELTLLTFECMAALSSSEAKWRELQEQGKITKLFRNLSGKNRALRMKMHENLVTAQNSAMNIMGELTKLQALSFSLISSLHEKAAQIQLENDEKFFALYQTIDMMYEDSLVKFEQLNSRVLQLEKRVRLIDWRQSISNTAYNGIPYLELSTMERIVCVVNDFYRATQGNWEQADEKYLEYMLLDLQLVGQISPIEFYERLSQDKVLFERLINGIGLTVPVDPAIYGEEPLIQVLNQIPISLHYKNEQPELSVRELAMSLLTQLAIIEQASRAPIAYELVLASISHVNDRLRINRTLHLDAGIALDQCSIITNNLPATVNIYSSLEEATKLKKALDQNKCGVLIIEAY